MTDGLIRAQEYFTWLVAAGVMIFPRTLKKKNSEMINNNLLIGKRFEQSIEYLAQFETFYRRIHKCVSFSFTAKICGMNLVFALLSA